MLLRYIRFRCQPGADTEAKQCGRVARQSRLSPHARRTEETRSSTGSRRTNRSLAPHQYSCRPGFPHKRAHRCRLRTTTASIPPLYAPGPMQTGAGRLALSLSPHVALGNPNWNVHTHTHAGDPASKEIGSPPTRMAQATEVRPRGRWFSLGSAVDSTSLPASRLARETCYIAP